MHCKQKYKLKISNNFFKLFPRNISMIIESKLINLILLKLDNPYPLSDKVVRAIIKLLDQCSSVSHPSTLNIGECGILYKFP